MLLDDWCMSIAVLFAVLKKDKEDDYICDYY